MNNIIPRLLDASVQFNKDELLEEAFHLAQIYNTTGFGVFCIEEQYHIQYNPILKEYIERNTIPNGEFSVAKFATYLDILSVSCKMGRLLFKDCIKISNFIGDTLATTKSHKLLIKYFDQYRKDHPYDYMKKIDDIANTFRAYYSNLIKIPDNDPTKQCINIINERERKARQCRE